VPLEGANGIRIKVVAVCHIDTSQWNPKHLAFEVLKVKLGTVPVCHFLHGGEWIAARETNGKDLPAGHLEGGSL